MSRPRASWGRLRLRRNHGGSHVEIAGRCRVDRRTKNLLRRLERGEIDVEEALRRLS